MSWTKVITVESLSEGMRQVVKVGDRKVLILNESGQFYAVDAICPHLKLPLKKGKITENGEIVCPFHRSKFDLKTGNVNAWCTFPPFVNKAFAMMSQEKPLSIFETRIEEGSLWVKVGS
jgi:nitrite reductase/ring-hydroxylating ferredoxin subunit